MKPKVQNAEDFNSLVELIKFFDTEKKCVEYLIEKRWGDKITCPRCGCDNIYRFYDGKRMKCGGCLKQFTPMTNTIFEGSRIGMQNWFISMWLLRHKKGISSYQLAEDLNVQQKTAWFILHRLRYMLRYENEPKKVLTGTLELDETFVGGKNKNRHSDKKVKNSQGRSFKDKTPVAGILKRKTSISISKVTAKVIPDTGANNLIPFVMDNVAMNAKLKSDEWLGYSPLASFGYDHQICDHGRRQFVNGDASTNGMENFWSHFKRSIFGIYHHVSPKHLQAYVDEAVMRFNNRDVNTANFISKSISFPSERLMYKTLIGK